MAPNQRTENGYNFTPTLHADTFPAIDAATKSNHAGHYVFISGASKGVGRATALALAKAGASGIALGARSSLDSLENEIVDAAKAAGKQAPKVLSIRLDVTDRASVEKAAKEVDSKFGKLDILINNAGYLEKSLPIIDSDPDEWWETWKVNLLGPYLMTRSLLPLILKSDSSNKQVINLSSIGAHMVIPGMSAYQITKLGIIRFSEFINAEYGAQGVVSYSVHPGGIMTELASNMPKQLHGNLSDKPEVAGDTIAWLTQEKQVWLAGRYVSCTWDMDELFGMEEEILEKDLLRVKMAVV